MNERINQILGQAYDEAVPETWTELSSEQLGRIYDKFAELIIRECMDVVSDKCASPTAYNALAEHFSIQQ